MEKVLTSDGNWLACGADYFTGLRHIGTDILVGQGSPVYAVASARVIAKSGPDRGWGAGNYALAIAHGAYGSNYCTEFVAVYGHIRTSLAVGAYVTAGQQIGTIGPYSTPHLHFGVRPGSASTFPSTNWGRVSDPSCTRPTATNGFTAPVTYIRTMRPA